MSKRIATNSTGWFEVYEAEKDIGSEMPILEIWNNELAIEIGKKSETKI